MNTTDDLQNTLINAAHDGDLHTVRNLLSRGVDANSTDADDRTPFNQALKRGIFYECINVCCNGKWESQVLAYRSIFCLPTMPLCTPLKNTLLFPPLACRK